MNIDGMSIVKFVLNSQCLVWHAKNGRINTWYDL